MGRVAEAARGTPGPKGGLLAPGQPLETTAGAPFTAGCSRGWSRGKQAGPGWASQGMPPRRTRHLSSPSPPPMSGPVGCRGQRSPLPSRGGGTASTRRPGGHDGAGRRLAPPPTVLRRAASPREGRGREPRATAPSSARTLRGAGRPGSTPCGHTPSQQTPYRRERGAVTKPLPGHGSHDDTLATAFCY